MTDISVEGVMERGVLPPNLTDNTKVVLPAGRYPVQVLIFFRIPSSVVDRHVFYKPIRTLPQVILVLENWHPGSADPNLEPAKLSGSRPTALVPMFIIHCVGRYGSLSIFLVHWGSAQAVLSPSNVGNKDLFFR